MVVSVVIPVLNEAAHITRTLSAARQDYGPDQVEIIVVDGGSTDATAALVSSDVVLLHTERGRAVQMNRGAAVARGDSLLFCHGDSQLPTGWREAMVKVMDRPSIVGGVFTIRLIPARGVLRLFNYLPFPGDWRTMYGDQAQFMRREAFDRVGGYAEMPILEDVEMMRRLRRLGRVVRLPQRVTTSSRRFLERGILRQLWLDIVLVTRYLYCNADPEILARDYYVTLRDWERNGAPAVK